MTDILDLIDGAIRDWDTSGDAMRWTPEPGRAEVVESVEHVTRAIRDLWQSAASGMVAPGHCRILRGDEVIYEGPVGQWP